MADHDLRIESNWVVLPEQFDEALFVGRKKEVRRVGEKVKRLQNGEIIKTRTMRISGERGVGKTWLSLRLHHDFRKKNGVRSIYIDCDQPIGSSQPLSAGNLEFRVEAFNYRGLLELLVSLSKKIGALVPVETSVQEQSGWLINKLTASDQVLVLFLDGLFSVNPDFVSLLENYLLVPLLSYPKTLIVMTGRGRAPSFINYYLNNAVIEIKLGPFEKKELEEFFDRLAKQSQYRRIGTQGQTELDEIYRASGGYPRTALLLAKEGVAQGIEKAVNALLGFIEDEMQRDEIRRHLEALVLLNRWDPELPEEVEWGMRDSDSLLFLNAYHFFVQTKSDLLQQELAPEHLEALYEAFQEWKGKKNKSYLRKVRQELQELQLLRWETIQGGKQEVRGYFIDEAIRYPVAYALWQNNRGLWQWLHFMGRKLFDRWAEVDPDRYKPLAEAHAKAIPWSRETKPSENFEQPGRSSS